MAKDSSGVVRDDSPPRYSREPIPNCPSKPLKTPMEFFEAVNTLLSVSDKLGIELKIEAAGCGMEYSHSTKKTETRGSMATA